MLRIESPLVRPVQVVADVHERRAAEGVAEVPAQRICCTQPREPVVGQAHGWNDLARAAHLQRRFRETCHLAQRVVCALATVRRRPQVRVVQEEQVYALDPALVDANLKLAPLELHADVELVADARRVACQVACLALPVALVVRRDDDDLLSALGEANAQLVDHHAQSAHRGPPAELGRVEHDGPELVL